MKIKNFFKDWIVPIIAAIILAVLINKFLFFQVSVPTKSMYPTIKPKDRMIVTRIYNKEKLKRGDIIVFYSEELGETLIKRLIGLPGDEIKIDQNRNVYVNGVKQDEPYVVYNGGKGGEFKVPEGHYFFMGDNRANSWDSRYWQEHYISADDIKGKARFIVFPFNRFGKFKYGEAAVAGSN
ncbi:MULTISPECIES: signal peptidase I [Clostridium]|uniref:Signal peptidase I n=2 Tax=Clostridium TaxID=1485 RepID=A0A151ANF3_9CLOT|nr:MULTISPECIES: signal peptidase I [Clostridium]KYH29161.1 signal peptidase I T [Clostridium colicanis DSM 13634]MBE6043729.1 signal peptidase I [Clostridium thermopalmarium]PRR73988.1 Signal peptidase I T [Clostridium thermopalmarium DSM 5974]PVZ20909.1 signal peptidase I [Clostridium thermopalmarium DSM 5974]